MTDFISVILATDPAASLALHQADLISGRSRGGPRTLPEALGSQVRGSDFSAEAQVSVLAVRLGQAELCPQLAGQRLKARVKYGCRRRSIACDSETTEVLAPAGGAVLWGDSSSVDFQVTSLFLEHSEFQPVIRLRLVHEGPLGRKLATAELRFARLRGSRARTLLLRGAGPLAGVLVGTMKVSVARYVMPKKELRECLTVLRAQKQKAAFLAGVAQVDMGVVVSGDEANSGEEDESAAPVLRGEPWYSMLHSPGILAVA